MDSNPTLYYMVGNGNYITASKSATIRLTEGRHSVSFYAKDAAGNTNPGTTLNLTYDITAPVYNVSLEEGWYNSTKTLTINASDNLDPNPIIAYAINGGGILNKTKSITLNLNEGVNLIEFLVYDQYGNNEGFQRLIYYIDLIAPIVNNNLEEGNYSSSKTITLTASDNLDTYPMLYYKINNGSWVMKAKFAQIKLNNGEYVIDYYAVDRAGNHGPIQTIIYNINNTNNETDDNETDDNWTYDDYYYPDVESNLVDGWYNESQNLTLESNSENLTVWYSINHGEFINGSNIVNITLNDGYYFIRYKGIDNGGNETTVKTLFVVVGSPSLPGNIINYNTGLFYNAIQDAIDADETLDWHLIEVLTGTYFENVVINKSVILVSYGKTNIIPVDTNLPTITLNKNDIVISGFNLVNNSRSSAIFINDVSNCTILENNFTENYRHISNQGNNISYGNWIIDNTFNTIGPEGNSGIRISNASNYFIYNNNFTCPSTEWDYSRYYYGFDYIGGRFAVTDLEYVDNFLIYGNYFFGYADIVDFRTSIHWGHAIKAVYSTNLTIQDNVFINLNTALRLQQTTNINITKNSFKDNDVGVLITKNAVEFICENINFNSFINNYKDLYLGGGSYNATNNWWGTNSAPLVGWDENYENIDIELLSNTTVYADPWIVASVYPSSYKIVDGKVYEMIITLDMTRNNLGEYISNLGYIPDGTIVDFISQYGNITNTAIVKDGKASAILTIDQSVNSNMTGVMAFVDNQMVYNFFDNIPFLEFMLFSTAIDQETGTYLNFSHSLPMNGSVVWVTLLWRETGLFTAAVDLIYNGEVILTKSIINNAYSMYKNDYREEVFRAIKDLNLYIGSDAYLTYGDDSLTSSEIIDIYLNHLRYNIYGLSDEEYDFVVSNHNYFVDVILNSIYYYGDEPPNIIITNPETRKDEKLNLPGNPSLRIANIYYDNNIYEGNDTGFEGMKSYAVAMTNISSEILSYWVSQKDSFNFGAMKAAYGTFLTALLVIYEHDRIADQAANAFNVSWSRTTPIMVSMNNEVEKAYITGEMDHHMGMDVIGDPINIYNFRMTCSFAFSLVEELVGGHNVWNNSEIGSVNLGILESIALGDKLVSYYSNGYLVVYTENNPDSALYIDLVSGIVRDAFSGDILGYPCYCGPITDGAVDYAQRILSGGQPLIDLEKMGNASINFGSSFGLIMGSLATLAGGWFFGYSGSFSF
ncbi:hypothetical protein [Methanobrevibacter arboriphilus]|uniref:hypothetical protein n=1 Tax=Methanobrevibacter arboriphilus TaxID=39441 RepID=UPI0006CF45FA|nr:hypothetical protein [Methanobrevibacter arboriphilus]